MDRLTCPAPRREWYNTGNGWAAKPWTRQGVADVKSYGGWFAVGHHEFESTAVARFAGAYRKGEEASDES